MEKRRLGFTDIELTIIGFGAWAIGGDGWQFSWGPQDDAESIATIQRALDLGINWIDTAPAYGLGRSEEVVGRAIKGRRDEVFVATKCGLDWDDQGNVRRDARPSRIRREVEESLRRLNVDVIDLYQIHWPDLDTPIEESWGTMADLIYEGKVRAIGVSNFTVPQLQRAMRVAPVASLQPPYSLLRRDVEAELLPFCRENNIGVVAYSPMQSGLLTDRFDPARLTADDWRLRDFSEEDFARARALVDQLSPLAAESGRTMAQLSVAWVNAQAGLTAAIVGARRPDQIEETVKAGEWALNGQHLQAIEKALAAVEA
jgi:aryl-alcohol dehydrogenase-like predicted oxidoreductase